MEEGSDGRGNSIYSVKGCVPGVACCLALFIQARSAKKCYSTQGTEGGFIYYVNVQSKILCSFHTPFLNVLVMNKTLFIITVLHKHYHSPSPEVIYLDH